MEPKSDTIATSNNSYADKPEQDHHQYNHPDVSLRQDSVGDQALLDVLPDLLLRVSRDGTYLDVHESSQVKTILPAAELLGKKILEVLPPVNAHEQMLCIEQALETREPQVFEQQVVIHGELHHEEVRVVVIGHDQVMLIIRDVSDRKRVQQHLQLQYAVTLVLAESAVPLEDILPKVLCTICESLGWQLGEFWILDDRDQTTLRCATSWHIPSEQLATFATVGQHYRFSEGTSFVGKLWASGQPCWLDDTSNCDGFLRTSLAVQAGLRSAMGIPIVRGDSLLGILVLFSIESRQFDAALVETMQAIGRQIGQLIEQKRIETENQRQNQLAQLLALTTLRIRESLDIQEMLTITVAEVRQFLNTQRVVVYQFAPGWGGKVIVESVAHGWQAILHQEIYDTCFTGVFTQHYQQGRSRAIEDICTEGLEPCYLALLKGMQVQASLVVPILVTSDLWGLLIAHHCESSRYWQPWEIDFLEKLAVQTGVGIQQANLYLQLSTELKERRRTEAQLLTALQELEQQKSALDEAAMVTRLNAEGIITYVNDKFCQISQYNSAEVIGASYATAAGMEQPSEFFQEIIDSVVQGQVWHGEVQNRAKDGGFYWTDTTVVPFLNSAGKPAEYLTIRFDITERKVVQEQLRAIQKRLQYLLASSPAVIYTRKLDALAVITFISPNCHTLMGWSTNQFIHDADFWISLLHSDDRHDVQASLGTLADSHHLALEYRLQNQDGDYRWIRDEMRLIVDEEGRSLECIGSMIDVTDRRIAEAQVLQTLEQERELSELKSRFVCNTSHEFRTPLATIFAASDLLKRFGHKLSEEKKQERLDKIQTEVRNMTRMLEDVLLLGKVSAKQRRFEPVLINLEVFCRDLLQETELVVGQNHTLRFETQGDCRSIVADEMLLKQIVNNLLSNAVKYSPLGGTVTLSLVCSAQVVMLQIQDQGIGIAKHDQECLFEDFFRASNVGDIPGTGLGLAIVKQAVDLHEGTIMVESELGQGSTITVSLPRTLQASPCE